MYGVASNVHWVWYFSIQIAYFLVHEVFIHQRFKWFRNSDNVYFRAIRRAHKVHHKHMGKEQGVFWYVNCTLEILKTRVKKANA
jgi:beta-carotene 3-hydroxylase